MHWVHIDDRINIPHSPFHNCIKYDYLARACINMYNGNSADCTLSSEETKAAGRQYRPVHRQLTVEVVSAMNS